MEKQKNKFKQTEIGKQDFVGKWYITKMSELDNNYVNEEVRAFIKIDKSGMGDFHFGLVQGSTHGDFKKNKKGMIFDFTWEGNAECDPASGDGWMKINEDGTAEGEIRFHAGDTSKFWAKKVTGVRKKNDEGKFKHTERRIKNLLQRG